MNKDAVLEMIAAGGVSYSAVRDQIKSGDLLLLHHGFVPTLYGLQIEAVQEFTGPFAHIAILDRVTIAGVDRVVVWESVVPKFRMVPVTATVEELAGFFWIPMNAPMSTAEREAAWAMTGKGEYSKPGAVAAGLKALPVYEDDNPRMWCAKATDILRRISGVELGRSYVPSASAEFALKTSPGRLQYVRMN
jgi:hypothetical protein